MEEYATKDDVFSAYKREELNAIDAIDAIEVLQEQFNMSSHEAEAFVDAWDN